MKIQGLARDVAWGAGAVVLATVAFMIGTSSGRSATQDSQVATAIASRKLAGDEKYNQTEAAVQANKAKLARLDDYEAKVSGLSSKLSSGRSELSKLEAKLSDGRSDLEQLTGKIAKERAKPIELPAGQFVVGRDIRSGRFTVVGDSNFVVKGIDGDIKVNTILGGGDIGVDRYVCVLEDGDEIEAAGADSFYPMD